jgi:hypothetical protein
MCVCPNAKRSLNNCKEQPKQAQYKTRALEFSIYTSTSANNKQTIPDPHNTVVFVRVFFFPFFWRNFTKSPPEKYDFDLYKGLWVDFRI